MSLAPFNEVKRKNKREAHMWLRDNGYDLVRKMWIKDHSVAELIYLPASGQFLIKEYLWAG